MGLNFGPIRSTERVMANYDYYDVAEGRGVIIYYGCKATAGNFLVGTKIPCNDIVTSSLQWSGREDYALAIDIDFDVQFNFPKVIDGTILVSVPMGTYIDNPGSINSYLIVKIRRVSSTGSEEDLASRQTDYNIAGGLIGTTESLLQLAEIPITQAHFKKGEKLRITIELWGMAPDPASAFYGIGHDPMDRNDPNTDKRIADTVSTILQAHVPFVIDV